MSRIQKTLSVTSRLDPRRVVKHNVTFYKRDHWRTDTGLILLVNKRAVYLAGGFNRFHHGAKRWEQKKTPHWYRAASLHLGYLNDLADVPASELETT